MQFHLSPHTKIPGILLPVLLALACPLLQAASKADYLEFFGHYRQLANSSNPAVVELYSDDAQITATRRIKTGVEQSIKIDGKRWKSMTRDMLELTRKSGAVSEYSNIRLQIEGNRAKISADRYSRLKCFHDKNYYMVVEEDSRGELRIVREFMETRVASSCPEKKDSDLKLTLTSMARMINRELPMMIDADTQLLRATASGNILAYHYVMVNHSSSELDIAYIDQVLRPAVVDKVCSNHEYTSILQQGGSISYRYSGNDRVQIIDIEVGHTNCH